MFKNAKFIGSPIPTNENTLYRFKKNLTISEIQKTVLSIFADSRYKLYINSRYVCEGPCIGTDHYYDSVEITDYLVDGENTVEVDVLYLGLGNGASSINRKYRVALLLEMQQGDNTILSTDESWDCAVDFSYEFYRSKYVHYNGYLNEKYEKQPLQWQKAVLLPYRGKGELWGVLGHYEISERPIAMYTPFHEKEMAVSKTDAVLEQKIYAGDTKYIVYELDKHSVGYPEFEFCGQADVIITYAESYAHYDTEKKKYVKNVRSDKSGEIIGASDELKLREDEFCYRPFFTKTARYIKLEITAITDFEIHKAVFMEYRYPLSIKNDFECSDKTYNKIFEVSVNTLENCTFDTYVDCPYYEMQQYTEDAYLEMMYTFMLTDDYSLPKKLITDLWQSQNYEGMQLASAPMEYGQITPTFCFFWIMMLEKYILYTGDRQTVRPMLSGIYSILSWFGNYINEKGVVGVYNYGKFIDWVWSWKNIFMVDDADKKPTSIVSLMYLYALKAGAQIFCKFGKDGVAEDLLKKYEELKIAVNKVYFDEEAFLYKDSAEGGYSEHSQIWAVLSEAVTGESAKRVLTACEDNELVHRCSYSYRFFKNRAYDMCGIPMELEKFLSDWKQMLLLDATTWFESPGDARSDCHAWSSVPIYEFTTKILGITPIGEGYSEVLFEPNFYHLDYAKGTVPTPYGNICVSWKKMDGICYASLSVPEKIKLKIGASYEGNHITKSTVD